VLNKLLTGAFRVGVGPGLVVKALARISGLEEHQLQHRLMGSFSPTAASFTALLAPLQGEGLPSSRPYPFLLACPLEPERLPPWQEEGWLAEWKWDGIRAQLIRRGGESFLWSRGEELINSSFPDLLPSIDRLPPGTVLDGELLVWPVEERQPQPFAQLQRRLGRRQPSAKVLAEAPACCLVYDLLEHEGVDRRALPLRERRALLEELLAGIGSPGLRLSTSLPLLGWQELESLRSAAGAAGAEGLMLKSLDGAYGSGRRRGVWWKHKLEPLRLDAVLLYARNGSGRRANLYTDYTFALWHQEEGSSEPRLVSFASAYSGLSDAELITIDRWIRRHTTERFGPVRAVAPELVFELAFEGVQRSSRHKSGIAVRFPRISRWRQDKPAAEADTLATALALIPP
ncbi:MAG: ATP-dependent DNA ligase, partial [Cyanobium sp.]